MASILVLADDLTGALETAAKFAEHGFPVRFITRPLPSANEGVIVATTESRHLSPELAAARVLAFACPGADIIYKKTDSGLRGNISAELGALHRAFPLTSISYIPSYPELGRTTRGGKLFIDGIIAHLSDLAKDALNPVVTSSVADIVGEVPCTIHDGETQDDVRAAVAATLSGAGPHILAGPASVSAAIAAHLRPAKVSLQWPRVQSCLLVNGSLHPRSAEQVRLALDQNCLSNGWRLFSAPALTNPSAREFAAAIGTAVVQEMERTTPEALMVFGGDTAFGILEAMGRPELEPIGEVVTGVPVSRIAAGSGPYLITKAGSFGPSGLICEVKKRLYGI
jgi:uncharacterized protein YgbK (DUF1537 family)